VEPWQFADRCTRTARADFCPFGRAGDGGPATSGELTDPGQVTVDGSGNLVIADTGSNRIREVAG
jgi:hypothetical protein